jgi:aminopeptidase N
VAAAGASLHRLLSGQEADTALLAYSLSVPSENQLSETLKDRGVAVDPNAVNAARNALRTKLARAFLPELHAAYAAYASDPSLPFELTPAAVGARQLSGLILGFLALVEPLPTVRSMAPAYVVCD